MTATGRTPYSILSALTMSIALIFGMGIAAAEPAHAASPFAGTYTGTSSGYEAILEVSADGKVTHFDAQFWFFCNGISTLNAAYWDTPVAVDSAGNFSKKLSDESISGTIDSKGEASVYYKSFYLGCAGDVGVTLKKAGPPAPPPPATVDVYTTPGNHTVNGRKWRTTCDKYSSTITRCRAEIFATQVSNVGGRFVSTNAYFFNNLTYLPSARKQWARNPLAKTGQFTSQGRDWKTSCNDSWTGKDGCRSFIKTDVISSYLDSGGNRRYKMNKDQWVFNNVVRFSN